MFLCLAERQGDPPGRGSCPPPPQAPTYQHHSQRQTLLQSSRRCGNSPSQRAPLVFEHVTLCLKGFVKWHVLFFFIYSSLHQPPPLPFQLKCHHTVFCPGGQWGCSYKNKRGWTAATHPTRLSQRLKLPKVSLYIFSLLIGRVMNGETEMLSFSFILWDPDGSLCVTQSLNIKSNRTLWFLFIMCMYI